MSSARQKKKITSPRVRPNQAPTPDLRRFEPITLRLRGTDVGDLAAVNWREENRARRVLVGKGPTGDYYHDLSDFDAEIHVLAGGRWEFWSIGHREDRVEWVKEEVESQVGAARFEWRRIVVSAGVERDVLRLERRGLRVHVMSRVEPADPSAPSPSVRELYRRTGERPPAYAHVPRVRARAPSLGLARPRRTLASMQALVATVSS